jgi:hypothetical protein
MKYTKQSLGRPAVFLLPSLKLKDKWEKGKSLTAEQAIEEFLLSHFGGFTVTAGNIFGYWRDVESIEGRVAYGEHRMYTVAFSGKEKIPLLEKFLAEVAYILEEKSVYFETGEDAWLIYPIKQGG